MWVEKLVEFDIWLYFSIDVWTLLSEVIHEFFWKLLVDFRWLHWHTYLVGGLEHFVFSIIYGMSSFPTDVHIFQRGRYTTNQLYLRWFLNFIHGVTAWASKRVVPVPPIQRQVPVLLWLFNGHSLELQFKDQKKDLFTRICTYYIVLQYDYMLVLLNSNSIWWFFHVFPGY